jgi:probable rRNA maturation factor
VGRAVRVLDASAASLGGGCPPGELSVAFVTDGALARLHMRFLGDPAPTDVITFGGDAGHASAGEICVSADAAARRAGRGQAALSRELALYVVHGWLHLAGYDDRDARSRRSMRAAEARAMRILSRAGALPRFKLA